MSNEAGETQRVSAAFQHTVMYWLLTSLALALFVPAALLPVYRDYAGWRLHRARVEAGIEALEAKAAENEAVIDALRTDPGVNARILARDLNYVAPGERVVRVLETPARDDVIPACRPRSTRVPLPWRPDRRASRRSVALLGQGSAPWWRTVPTPSPGG